MLSSLPTELVREITESAVPHSFNSTTYRERQRTLCSLSLVSKLLRSIAQPLLSEIVWIKSTSEIDRLPKAGASRISRPDRGVKCAVIESRNVNDARSADVKGASLERALQLLQSVTTLTVTAYFGGYFDVCSLEDLLDLKHLHLVGHAWRCSRTPIFPKIESLTLHILPLETLEALLSQHTLPKLKQFALVDTDSAYLEALERSDFRQLLPQLEVLSFDLSVWLDPEAAFLYPAASRTLVDCTSFHLGKLSTRGPPAVNLRICEREKDVIDMGTHRFCKSLDDYGDFIRSNPSLPLRRVYMDSSLERVFNPLDQLELSLTSFWRICEERQIDLIFEPVPDNFDIDSYLSSDFLRRRRRIAEKD